MEGKDDGRDDASIPPSPMPPASASPLVYDPLKYQPVGAGCSHGLPATGVSSRAFLSPELQIVSRIGPLIRVLLCFAAQVPCPVCSLYRRLHIAEQGWKGGGQVVSSDGSGAVNGGWDHTTRALSWREHQDLALEVNSLQATRQRLEQEVAAEAESLRQPRPLSEWRELYSVEHRRRFWVHSLTKETSWCAGTGSFHCGRLLLPLMGICCAQGAAGQSGGSRGVVSFRQRRPKRRNTTVCPSSREDETQTRPR